MVILQTEIGPVSGIAGPALGEAVLAIANLKDPQAAGKEAVGAREAVNEGNLRRGIIIGN